MALNFFKIGAHGKLLVRFASAKLLVNFLRLVAGFLVVRFVAPKIYGSFTGIGVYLGYFLLGHFGLLNGLGRELPFELAQGRKDYSSQLISVCSAVSIVIGAIISVTFSFFAIRSLLTGGISDALIFATYAITGFFLIFNQLFFPILYNSTKKFDRLAVIQIANSIANIASVILVWAYGLLGLCLRAVFLAFFLFLLYYKYRPRLLTPRWRFAPALQLFRTGLPIYLVGHVTPLWNTVMNNLVYSIGGAMAFGHYALSTIIKSTAGVIPAAFSSVVYPHMTEMYAKGRTVGDMLNYSIKPTILQTGLLFLACFAGVLLLPSFVYFILPKYAPGIRAAQWALFIPLGLSLGLANNIFNVIKKQQWYFVSILVGSLFGTAFLLVLYSKQGFVLEFFPQGILVGTIVQQIFCFFFLFRMRSLRHISRQDSLSDCT